MERRMRRVHVISSVAVGREEKVLKASVFRSVYVVRIRRDDGSYGVSATARVQDEVRLVVRSELDLLGVLANLDAATVEKRPHASNARVVAHSSVPFRYGEFLSCHFYPMVTGTSDDSSGYAMYQAVSDFDVISLTLRFWSRSNSVSAALISPLSIHLLRSAYDSRPWTKSCCTSTGNFISASVSVHV